MNRNYPDDLVPIEVQGSFSPLYSCLSIAKGMNARWEVGCKAGTEQSELTQVNPNWEFLFSQF
jgi:hypothetical protein